MPDRIVAAADHTVPSEAPAPARRKADGINSFRDKVEGIMNAQRERLYLDDPYSTMPALREGNAAATPPAASAPALGTRPAATPPKTPAAEAPLQVAFMQRSILDPMADAMLRPSRDNGTPLMTDRMIEAPPPMPAVATTKPPTPAPVPQAVAPAAVPTSMEDIPGPVSQASPFDGLQAGDSDSDANGPVRRMQRVLKKWNERLELVVNGRYDAATDRAVLLCKSIYASGSDGSRIDAKTGGYLAGVENGSFWKNPPEKTAAGRLLYAASRQIGVRYDLGGDGSRATDCAMLTKKALVSAGLAGDGFSRLADVQYRYAEKGARGLQQVAAPSAGDLVFFNHPTSQTKDAYKGVTHVGLWLGDGQMLAAFSQHGRVVVPPLGKLARHVAGFARAVEAQ
ncbi:MAG: hypothetical protein FJX76_04960 [Armatimonadetes bacterium]|nr:hypothetical protein [Armatimonadota bacterium]